MRETETRTERAGRNLGDEWEDWDGDVASHEGEIDESARPFVLFLVVTFFIYWCAAALLGYLILPRLQGIDPRLGTAVIAAVAAFVAVSGVWLILMLISSGLGRPVLAGRFSRRLVMHFLNRFLLGIARMSGYSRDRMGHSFIKLSNILTRSSRGGFQNTIVLLPRCLRKDVRAKVLEIAERFDVPTHTVGGGEQARRVVTKEKPDSILAVACERDLAAGMIDTSPSIAVIGIPNVRREGPCRNTEVDTSAFEEALAFFKT